MYLLLKQIVYVKIIMVIKLLNIKEIVVASNGILINGNDSLIPSDYKIDSRELRENEFFIPIIGENEDGHKYIVDIVKKGAIGFFISKSCINKEKIINESLNLNPDVCIVEVQDPEKSLRDIAMYNRNKHLNIPVVAITGSVGKTSTREMIASVLSEKYTLLVTEKNYNSIIGLPIMLLKMDKQDICVLEAGINHIGEMDILSKLLKPDVCVITNIGNAHIGIMGSRDNIFKEKMKITNNIKGLKNVIVNGDDEYLSNLDSKEYNLIKYSLKDISNKIIEKDFIKFDTSIYNKNYTVTINQIGNHNIQNALSAIKVGEVFNLEGQEIINGIGKYKNFSGRLEIKNIKENITIIDDTYNASIDSMKSGLITVNDLDGIRKIAVLGDMLELGEYSKKIHLEVGEIFKTVKYDFLYTLGEEAKNIALTAKKYMGSKHVKSFNSKCELEKEIKNNMKAGDIIYFKASNAMKFSDIITELQK